MVLLSQGLLLWRSKAKSSRVYAHIGACESPSGTDIEKNKTFVPSEIALLQSTQSLSIQ
jgi:hypothetical protein